MVRLAGAALVLVGAPTLALAPSAAVIVPKGTLVTVELTAPVSSEQAKNGDHFPIRLIEPVLLNGATAIPAGATGEGEVIHAAKARRYGMPGELIVTVRFVTCGATMIRLGHLQFSSSGSDQSLSGAFARTYRYPTTVMGGTTALPAGARGIAKVAVDTELATPGRCQVEQATSSKE